MPRSSGDVRIAGRVDGSVVVANGTTTVSGVIDGDLVAISDSARLLPGARIDGDLLYGGDRPRIAPSAEVTGEVSDEDWSDAGCSRHRSPRPVFRHARERPWVAVAVGLGTRSGSPPPRRRD